MNSTEARKVKVGDLIVPDNVWNRSERVNKLATPTEVFGVKEAVCETGILFRVRYLSGTEVWLSAGWFMPPIKENK